MVQITRQKVGGLGLSIKGGAEHKLPILISRIYQGHAADLTGQLFVGDAIIKVNGEYITGTLNHESLQESFQILIFVYLQLVVMMML